MALRCESLPSQSHLLSKRTACAGQVRALARYLHEPLRANLDPPAARNPFVVQRWNWKEKSIIDCFELIKKYRSLKNNRERLFELDVPGEILPLSIVIFYNYVIHLEKSTKFQYYSLNGFWIIGLRKLLILALTHSLTDRQVIKTYRILPIIPASWNFAC